MAMTKITFQDLPNTTTPINASNLNAVQDNVDTAKLDKTGGTISGNLAITGTLKQDNKDVLVETSGNWTPAINTVEGVAPTINYTNVEGKYKKIGNLVFIYFYIKGKITALNGTDNFGIITGLPFATSYIYFGQNVIPIGVQFNLVADNTKTNLNLLLDNTILRIQYNYGASACKLKVTPQGDYDFFEIGGSGWYAIG